MTGLLLLLWSALFTVGLADTPSAQELGRGLRFQRPATVYTAREILTMNPEQPEAEAVAVLEGRILAVGSLAEVQTALGDRPYTVDRRFDSKTLTAGFLAQHVHPFLATTLLFGFISFPTARPWPSST